MDAREYKTPLKNAADGFAAFTEMKEETQKREIEEGKVKYQLYQKQHEEDLQRRIASGDPHNLYPADGEPFRQAWVKEFKLPDDTPFEKVARRYNDMVNSRNRGGPSVNPLEFGNTAHYNFAADVAQHGLDYYSQHHGFGGKKTRKNRRKTKRRS